jgi:hypothetical protein
VRPDTLTKWEFLNMTLRQFLHDNFGWDIYDWADEEIRF